MLRSYILENNLRTLYQEGPVTAMLDPLTLIDKFGGKKGLQEGTLMFCGTLAARGGIRPSRRSSSSSRIPCWREKFNIDTGCKLCRCSDEGTDRPCR